MAFIDETNSQWPRPGAIYRSGPFWSWNSKLDPDRLVRAVDAMHEAGMGGFFMHSRYGLKTPYLSETWFECISACVERARELGMKAYLYDEDRWPSGAAGGLVTRDNPDYRIHLLIASRSGELPDSTEPLCWFHVGFDGDGRMTGYEPLDGEPDQRGEGTGNVLFGIHTGRDNPWHNDGAYLDTMNADAVAEFVRVTHQAYADRYGGDFGELIPAIFTDEPNYGTTMWGMSAGSAAVQWTLDLPRHFRQRRGYDLRDHLPELFFPVAGKPFSKVRLDFRRTACELFVEAFSAQIGDWCGRHDLALTGHMLAEETLGSQTGAIGAAMPHYPHMQWPGIDILTDQADELLTAKQCTSVAAQFGKDRVLSELYGCTGWDWPLEGHKFVGDWHAATGVNFRCPHLTHYSLAGGAKRDYPASIFAHSPWWEHYATVEDYFARINFMLTRGRPIRDVLVIHPIESAWGLHTQTDTVEADALSESLKDLTRTLAFGLMDFDLGDESILAEHAAVRRDRLSVGQMSYKLAIVPPCRTLRASTVEQLEGLIKGGGKVLFVGRLPDLIDGEPDEQGRLAQLVQSSSACQPEHLLSRATDLAGRRVQVTDNQNNSPADFLWSMLREVDGGRMLFLQSHDREHPRDLSVSVEGQLPVVAWDAQTGRRERVPAKQDGKRVTFPLCLPPTGSALLSLGVPVEDAQPPASPGRVTATQHLTGPFHVERSEPNTMPLDTCRYRIGDGDWSEVMPTLLADTEIRAHYGLGTRLGREQQPWYLYATGVVDTADRDPIELEWTFHVTETPSQCKLALEMQGGFRIYVNGEPAREPDGWWVDEDFRTIDITALLSEGTNTVTLACTYRPDMELEDMYLVGEFGTHLREGDCPAPGRMTLVASPQQLDVGPWQGQGLDFYGGAVRYSLNIAKPAAGQRARLSLPGIRCTMAVVRAGGTEFVLPWPPFQVDLTDALSEGDNEVTVELVGGRKNILGPLHTPWVRWTGPGQFDPRSKEWTFEYQLNAHGLFEPPLLETLK